MSKLKGLGTAESPWQLKTPPGTSDYQAYTDEAAEPPALVVQVGKTQLRYHLRCIQDLHVMLQTHGDWIPLGSADEQKPAAEGTVEAWGRASNNPVKGWYGLKKGLRGRFGMYIPPVSGVQIATARQASGDVLGSLRKGGCCVARRLARGQLAFAAHVAGAEQPAYFILVAFSAGRVSAIRDFRYVPYIASEAEFAALER